MVKVWKEKGKLVDTASAKIAGTKHGHTNEVQAQVRKAKSVGVAKSTLEVVKNLTSKKVPKPKY